MTETMHKAVAAEGWDLVGGKVTFDGKIVGDLEVVGPKIAGVIFQEDMSQRLRKELFFIHEVSACPTCGCTSMEVRVAVRGVDIGSCRSCGTPLYRIGLDVYRQSDNKNGYVRSTVKGLVL